MDFTKGVPNYIVPLLERRDTCLKVVGVLNVIISIITLWSYIFTDIIDTEEYFTNLKVYKSFLLLGLLLITYISYIQMYIWIRTNSWVQLAYVTVGIVSMFLYTNSLITAGINKNGTNA